ncbi:hypothetical protein NP552_04715 [Pseudomonas sp. 8209]|uniref:hypothetical protein n=1 Tax=Pseudomonas sp. 8209 TaxID=2967214 RepID=UPI0023646325|nr:hypothetical protein [Pseudomonas sp. 8209]MDD1954342.1 hypothetical protein [Pseudomonas sp. 8209]
MKAPELRVLACLPIDMLYHIKSRKIGFRALIDGTDTFALWSRLADQPKGNLRVAGSQCGFVHSQTMDCLTWGDDMDEESLPMLNPELEAIN